MGTKKKVYKMAAKKASGKRSKRAAPAVVAKRRPRNQRLPTMEFDEKIEELEDAAASYMSLSEKAGKLKIQADEARQIVVEKMEALGKSTYRPEGLMLSLSTKKKLTCRRLKDEAPAGEATA